MKNLLAQGDTIDIAPGGGGSAVNFTRLTNFTVGGIIQAVITFILIGAGLIFFFMLIIGGVQWILSGGDKAKTEGARNQITAALIGLVIVFAAWAIATLMGSFFGINILNFTTPQIEEAGQPRGE